MNVNLNLSNLQLNFNKLAEKYNNLQLEYKKIEKLYNSLDKEYDRLNQKCDKYESMIEKIQPIPDQFYASKQCPKCEYWFIYGPIINKYLDFGENVTDCEKYEDTLCEDCVLDCSCPKTSC